MNKAKLYATLSPNILVKIGRWVSTKHTVQQQLLYSILRSTDKYQRDRNRWQQKKNRKKLLLIYILRALLDNKKKYIHFHSVIFPIRSDFICCSTRFKNSMNKYFILHKNKKNKKKKKLQRKTRQKRK